MSFIWDYLKTVLVISLMTFVMLKTSFFVAPLINTEWNWFWPIILLAGTYLAYVIIGKLDKSFLRVGKNALWGVVFVFIFKFLKSGFPSISALLPVSKVLFQFATSILEEVYYRWFIYTALFIKEKRCYSHKISIGPLSVFISSLIFGLGHGLNPIFSNSGSFDFVWYSETFDASISFFLLMFVTKSVWPPAILHFLENLWNIYH